MTVFSCGVKGVVKNPSFDAKVVHDLTRKKPSRPAATLSEGMTPTVRLSLCVIIQKSVPKRALTTRPLTVSCSFHGWILPIFGLTSTSGSVISVPMMGRSGCLDLIGN